MTLYDLNTHIDIFFGNGSLVDSWLILRLVCLRLRGIEGCQNFFGRDSRNGDAGRRSEEALSCVRVLLARLIDSWVFRLGFGQRNGRSNYLGPRLSTVLHNGRYGGLC